jgi:hypothetical protein
VVDGMKFMTKGAEEAVTSKEHLLELVESGMREERCFTLGENSQRCLQLGVYSEDGALLELHRGKKWEAWISPSVLEPTEVAQIFLDYYQHGDLSEERLNGDPEWLEAAGFHPAVYLALAVVVVAAVVYVSFFR